jgi:hypothetical protein
VKRQIGERELAVQIGGAQVDPELSRNLAVDRSGAAVRRWRARLFFGRQPLHLHVGVDLGVEGTRQLRANPREAFLDERQDLGATLVAVCEFVFRILRDGLHALADRAWVSQPLHDAVHLPWRS